MTQTEAPSINSKSSTVDIIPVRDDLVDWWWPFAGKYVDDVVTNYGEVTGEDVRHACKTREMQLWVIQKDRKTVGAATTMVVNYARKRVVRVVTLSGEDFDAWGKQAVETLNAWASEVGAVPEVCARKGFEPKLKKLGFNTNYVVMIYGTAIGVADPND